MVTDFSEDQVLSQTYTELRQVRLSLAELGTQESVLKQRLQEAMGPATKAVFAEGSVTWKKAKDSVALDLEALLKARPELKALYQTSKPGSRRFLVS